MTSRVVPGAECRWRRSRSGGRRSQSAASCSSYRRAAGRGRSGGRRTCSQRRCGERVGHQNETDMVNTDRVTAEVTVFTPCVRMKTEAPLSHVSSLHICNQHAESILNRCKHTHTHTHTHTCTPPHTPLHIHTQSHTRTHTHTHTHTHELQNAHSQVDARGRELARPQLGALVDLNVARHTPVPGVTRALVPVHAVLTRPVHARGRRALVDVRLAHHACGRY